MSGKGFLGNMTENLQADFVQSRQAGFIQCFLYSVFPLCSVSFMQCFLYAKNSAGSPSFTARMCSGACKSGSRKPPSMHAELQNANMDG